MPIAVVEMHERSSPSHLSSHVLAHIVKLEFNGLPLDRSTLGKAKSSLKDP